MNTNAWLVVGIVVGACVAACGDDGSGGATLPTPEELPPILVDALCAELEGCLGPDTSATYFGPGGCEGRLLAQVEDGDFGTLQDAIDDGLVLYYPEHVDPCLEQIAGLGCDLQTTRSFNQGACEQAFAGTIDLGGDCNTDAQCKGVAFCKHGFVCPGTCSELLGANEDCERDDDCEAGLACPKALGKCSAPAELGEACGAGIGAAACRAGLACIGQDRQAGTPGECKDPAELYNAALGVACELTAGELCVDDLACAITVGSDPPTFECVERVEAGAPCRFAAPSMCADGEFCDADIAAGEREGTCKPLLGAGEACDENECEPGLICDTDAKCHPINRLGQPCVSDAGCASGFCSIGTCERPQTCEL